MENPAVSPLSPAPGLDESPGTDSTVSNSSDVPFFSSRASVSTKATEKTQTRSVKSRFTEHVHTDPHISRLSRTGLQLFLSVLALALLVVVIIFIQSTPEAQSKSRQQTPFIQMDKLSVSTTLATIRACQGVLAAISAIMLREALVLVQWMLMARQAGTPYSSVLALSPTTGNWGTWCILKSTAVKKGTKGFALSRFTLTSLLFLSGMILYFDTSLLTVYDTAYTYPVTAGVGPFNASLVSPFLSFLQSTAPDYPYTILPFTYHAVVYSLVTDPLLSTTTQPIDCTSPLPDMCASFLLTGGLNYVAPWTPAHSLFAEHPMIKVDAAPAMQLSFQLGVSDVFDLDHDCDTFGAMDLSIGILLCLKPVGSNPATIRAGMFVCDGLTPEGICNLAMDENGSTPNITSTLSFHTRQATFVAARSNGSIVSITETPAVPVPRLSVPEYRQALAWLLNFTAAGIPGPSSVAQIFWSSQQQMASGTYGVLAQNFQSILAFPVWLFNDNNWGNVALLSNQITPGMPDEFHTVASVVRPYVKIRFNSAMFGLFVFFQSVVLVFSWAVLAWVWVGGDGGRGREMPATSAFPLFDLAFKSRVLGVRGMEKHGKIAEAESGEILEVMRDARAVAGREG